MSLVRQLARGLRALIHPEDRDRDLADEVHHYFDQAEAAHRASGMTAEAAAHAARRDAGNQTFVRETTRISGWEHALEVLVADVRYALRGLRNAPGFAIAAAGTIAIGIGAVTAVFGAVSPLLLEPLPFPQAHQLVTVMDRNATGDPSPPTLGTYQELLARDHSFAKLAASDGWQPSLVGGGDPEHLGGQRVTANYFSTFGTVPLLGRDFTAADDRVGGPRVVILSGGLWQRRFGADRSIVGRSVELNGVPWLVIGVMPNSFANVLAPRSQLWSPMQETATGDYDSRAWGHHYQVVARLAPTATVVSALQETIQIGARPVSEFPRPPWAGFAHGLLVTTLQNHVIGNLRTPLYAIIGAVLLLLTIAAVNVTNLLLARGARRRNELAMRSALGAGRSRLLRQVITESVVLALVGGLGGMVIATVGLRALLAASPASLPRADAVHLDVRMFIFALVLTLIVGMLVGLIPAFRTMRSDLSEGLRPGTRRTTGGREAARGTLVVVEAALALMLVVGAGLLFRSVQRLTAVPPGFDASNVMTMQVVAAGRAFSSDTTRLQFLQQVVERVRQLPGVASAGFTSQLPLSGEVDGYGFEAQSIPGSVPGELGSALRYDVTPGYFDAMRIRLLRGRLLNANDHVGGPEALLINESLARRLFHGRDPIGERLRFGPETGTTRPWDYVVGVVADVRQYSLAVPAPDAFYIAQGQWPWVDNVTTLVVRARGDAMALAPSIKRAVWSVNHDVPIQRIEAMTAFVTASAGQRRFVLLAIEVVALTALLLAAVGLYGMISGGVNERTREIGIRLALGARPGAVVGTVVSRALLFAAAGSAIGVIGALAASRLLAGLLFGVSRGDPLTYLGGVVILTAVAVLSAWAPARRAARVDPTVALRAE